MGLTCTKYHPHRTLTCPKYHPQSMQYRDPWWGPIVSAMNALSKNIAPQIPQNLNSQGEPYKGFSVQILFNSQLFLKLYYLIYIWCPKPFWSQICKEAFGNVCISASAAVGCEDQCSACLPVIRAMFLRDVRTIFWEEEVSPTDEASAGAACWDACYMIPLHFAKSPKKMHFFSHKFWS